jgi:hypothetical protein
MVAVWFDLGVSFGRIANVRADANLNVFELPMPPDLNLNEPIRSHGKLPLCHGLMIIIGVVHRFVQVLTR